MPENPQPMPNKIFSIMVGALVVSVALNVLLAHRVRTLTDQRSVRAAELGLRIGTSVPPITAKRLDGQSEVISYQRGERPTLLYVFTPTCSWCARNIDNFKALLAAQSNRYRFIGLSLSGDGLSQYVAKNDLTLPVYSDLSPEMLKVYKLRSTPQTIVVSAEGKIVRDWLGAYVGDQKSQVEAFFNIRLPGLKAVSTDFQ